MTQPHGPDLSEDVPPARLRSAVGAVLGIAVALLLSILPGTAINGARLPTVSAVSTDQLVLAAANRFGDARATVQKARGTAHRRTDFSGGTPPLLLAGLATIVRIQPEAAPFRPALASTAAPARWPSTAQARAPPRA